MARKRQYALHSDRARRSSGEQQTINQIAAGAIDAEADPIDVPIADLVADQRLQLMYFARRDRPASSTITGRQSPTSD